ncbi:MAG: recombinase family protein [Candidatus Gastranaerophilaceae bacterium]
MHYYNFSWHTFYGRYIYDEEKTPIVREIFTRYAAGEKAVAICEDLNKRGFRTYTGGEFNKNSFHTMFKNNKYMGIYHFKSKDPDLKDVHNEDKIPAIITKELFKKVQARINSNKHKKSKKRLEDMYFLLSGKAYDGNCGGAFIGDSGTSKNGETYYYYTCQNKKTRKGCKTKSVRFWLEQFRDGEANKESYKKQVIDTFVNAVVLYEDIVTIAFNYTNNEIIDIPIDKLKNSSDSVRMSLINWGQIDKVRTFLLESVKDEDSFLRTLQIA